MSRQLQLVGIGNALVDLQFEVSEQELNDFEFQKGTMTLVSAEKQKQLISSLNNRRHIKCSGGSAANTIIAFTGFGGKSAYQSVIGNDSFGEFYANEFHNLGISLDEKQKSDAFTGTSFIMITPDSERTMATTLGASAEFSSRHLNKDMIINAEWLYIEGYKFSENHATEAINEAVWLAKKNNTKIAITFSDKFITEIFRDNLESVAKQADLIFCNELEAMTYAKASTFEDALEFLKNAHSNLAITRAEKGSVVVWNDNHSIIEAYQAIPVDSTGAGDMYAAGFLWGIIHSNSEVNAAKFGSYAAAKVISQFGARLNEDHIELRDYVLANLITV